MPKTDQKHDDFSHLLTEEEGQLSVDVLETDNEIIVRSTIAGVKPEDLQIHLTSDLLTIRGKRAEEPEHSGARRYASECYWGKFSRSVILPQHVRTERAAASLSHGLLTVRLPKSAGDTPVPLSFKK